MEGRGEVKPVPGVLSVLIPGTQR
uniref:Uncharacterized protein n=1 Tax=Moniliophthora roreri TaxID=221103 RepID=A0A0W0GCD6_MONRR